MYCDRKQLIRNAYCISICILAWMPRGMCDQHIEDKYGEIYFRKCCEENEVYEYTQDKCIEKHSVEISASRQNYPINFVHEDFSV